MRQWKIRCGSSGSLSHDGRRLRARPDDPVVVPRVRGAARDLAPARRRVRVADGGTGSDAFRYAVGEARFSSTALPVKPQVRLALDAEDDDRLAAVVPDLHPVPRPEDVDEHAQHGRVERRERRDVPLRAAASVPAAPPATASSAAAAASAIVVRTRARIGASVARPHASSAAHGYALADVRPRRQSARATRPARALGREARVDAAVQARDGMADRLEHPLDLVLAPLVDRQLDA